MSWRDLLGSPSPVRAPWLGGRTIHADIPLHIDGPLPVEHGWFRFEASQRRRLSNPEPCEPSLDSLVSWESGYLVGDRLVRDDVAVPVETAKISSIGERVFLIEPGLDHFSRIKAGRMHPRGPLIFASLEMPLGPESDVAQAFLDRTPSLHNVPHVSPSLDAAFRLLSLERNRAEQQRAEDERRRREEEERMAKQQRFGSALARRAAARLDFTGSASAALQLAGCELLDHRPSRNDGEHIVRFRVDGRRFECVCDTHLRIIDAGICLQDSATGIKGDTWFTLESLPSVIREAIERDVLVVFRHA